ncbi:MAG: hypothetical protein RLY31_1024 [Bacteroidota bacterium]
MYIRIPRRPPDRAGNFSEYGCYLLRDAILPQEPKKSMAEHWSWIFKQALFGICTDKGTWQKKMTWKMYSEWFGRMFSTVVLDLVNGPIDRKE